MSRNDVLRARFGDLLASRDERLPNDGTHPLYSLTIKDGVTPKTDRYEREFLVTNKESKKYKVIRKGDLVFNPSNLRWGAIATSFVQFPVLASPIYEVFHPKDDSILDPFFLGVLASSPMLMAKYLSLVEGTLVERTALKKDDFLEIEVEIPTLPEQKKIAEILSGIDSCIARYQEKARVLAMTHEVMASRIYTDIHEDPTTCISRIDEISTLKGGNGFPVEHQGRTAGGTPFIKVSDFNTPGNEYSILNANNYLSAESMAALRPSVFPRNTIVFAKVGAALTSNRRRVLSMPTCIDNNLMGAIPGNIHPLYLKFLLERIDFNEFVQDGAVPSVNQSQVGQIKVPVPSLDKQVKVIESLESIREYKHLLDSTINKRITLKQAIATDLLSGRKRVSV